MKKLARRTEAIRGIRRPRYVTFEEGPLADWLLRNLSPHADEVLVCEPRRNRLIAKDSDKDDPIDAEKLAQLYRGGYLKRVHHPESLARAIFKQHVAAYHEAVGLRVARANRILAQFRQHGVFLKEADFARREDRPRLLARLPASQLLRDDVACLWLTYDTIADQEAFFREELVRRAQRIEPIRRFEKVPGVKWIRGATFYAYLDTPWRFRGKSALWKYLGVGLERKHSGSGPTHVQVSQRANHPLKDMILARGHHGHPPRRQSVCQAVSTLDRERRTFALQRASQRGPQPGDDVLGHVEKRKRVPTGMGDRPGRRAPRRQFVEAASIPRACGGVPWVALTLRLWRRGPGPE